MELKSAFETPAVTSHSNCDFPCSSVLCSLPWGGHGNKLGDCAFLAQAFKSQKLCKDGTITESMPENVTYFVICRSESNFTGLPDISNGVIVTSTASIDIW